MTVSSIALILVPLLLAIPVLRALATPRAAAPAEAPPADDPSGDAGIADKLAAAVRFPTVSSWEPGREDDGAFAAFVAALPGLFPRVHAALRLETPGNRALLYTWEGSEAGSEPAILCSHFDVVPAEDAEAWRHGPFSGDIAAGEVWGRGTQDVKLTLVSALEAAERLLAKGFRPRRTILFAFGGDEETGGARGAGRIAALLASRGTRASFLLDEGGPVARGMLSFADRPLALVGVAEKGYLDILLEAKGGGGHASMPPRRGATGDIARAVAALEASPAPARLCATVRSFLGRLSPYVPFAYRLLFRNLGLTAPLVRAAFSAAPTTNALVRTTAVATMLSGSPKENVLAERATAVLNARILPGEDSAGTLARVARVAARFSVTARAAHPESVVEPLPESPLDHDGWRAVEAAIARAFPEAAAIPFLFGAGTDTKHYRGIAGAMYRFTPLVQGSEELKGVHGRDERVTVAGLGRCLRFYEALIASL